MLLSRERGELSLIWIAVLMACLAFVAMAGLFAWRYQRNLFAEAWVRLMPASVTQILQKTGSVALSSLKPAASLSAEVRKCTINGQVVYSNVECGANNPSSRALVLHDTRGIEAPKTPPSTEAAVDVSTNLKDKIIEQRIQPVQH